MSIVKRLERVENAVGPGWVIEVMALVNDGKFTPGDVLDDMGTAALEHFPKWYRDMPREEREARAAAADDRIRAVFAPYTEEEIDEMLAGRRPFPEGL